MEKKKQLIALIAVGAVLVVALAVLFFAGGYKIKFEETFAADLAYEYGQEADIPKAYVVNKFGIRQIGKVEYEFTSADGVVTKTNYPVAKCDSVGDWKVTCTYKSAEVTKEFKVVDTVAPEIIVGALPSDVYVGNTDVEYTVPGVDFKDSSPIDYDKSNVSLYFEGEQVQYNTLTNAFIPETDGKYTFKIEAYDIYGNKAEEECSWRAKDANWTDTNLPDGYLATFDVEGYANLISSGFINEYWTGTETEEFLEEYEGEKGVLKVKAEYNVQGLTVFNVKLAKTITPEKLGNDVIIIRYRLDDNGTDGKLTLAGNYQESIQSAAAKYFTYTPGEWATAILTAEDLKNYQYVDEDGVLRSLQMGFGRNGSGSSTEVYLASVTVGKKLDTPQNLRVSGKTLRWDAVKDAEGYVLYIDGEESQVGKSELSCAMGNNKMFQVIAKGDNLFTVDSDAAMFVNDTPAEGYLAEFNEEYYKYLVWNNGAGAEGGMEWYESDSFAASYDEKEKAVKLDLTQGYVTAGTVVRLPKQVSTDSIDSMVIRFKVDENVKCVRVYQYGGPGLMMEYTDVKEGWNSLVIPKASILGDGDSTKTVSGYQLMFYANKEPVNGKGQGTQMTVYLGDVTKAVQLDAPTNLKLSGKKLTWDVVKNAKSYVVIEDGKEKKVSTNSYTGNGGALFEVYAVGDNKFYVDSEKAMLVNGSVKQGYLATFDEAYYQYLIWNNGANAPGGMQWYESDSFKATYDKNAKHVKVDMTYGYVCAGSVVKFPEIAKVSELSDIVVRMKVDSTVKQVSFYQYGGIGLMMKTSDVKEGWNTFVIPKASVLADGGSEDTMSGMQIILYSNAEGQMGVKQGTATTMYLGTISTAEKLSQPENVKISGNTLTWDKVSGAVGYEVLEDGKATTVKTNSYTSKGGNLFKVAALGDNQKTVNSDYTIYVNATVAEGYLATFDKEFYEYLIWNNGANAEGGMQWYESETFEAKYNASTKLMDITAKYGYVCAGMVVKFPETNALENGKDVVVNIKVDDTVKSISIYPYGIIGNLLNAVPVQTGWNRIVIPQDKLAEVVGTQDFAGLQIMLNDNVTGSFTESNPSKTAKVSLGTIYYATTLDKPVLIVEGTNVSWETVTNAASYDIYINDEFKGNQTATTYSVAGLANGVYEIKVVAKSNQETYLDSISDGAKYSNLLILTAPAMTYSDGTVSFEKVTGSIGYKIEINGTEYDVDQDATSVKPADLIGKSILAKYRIKALGDWTTTADSEWSEYKTNDLSLADNYIADFDEGYTQLVWNNGSGAEGGMQWYECDSFASQATDEGIKLTLKHGYVCAGIVTKFPTPVKKSDISNMVIRIKLDSNVKMVRIYEFGGPGKMLEFKDLQEGWNDLVIPQSNLLVDPGKDVISGLQIMLHTSNNPQNGDGSQGTNITAVLGSVKNLKITEEIDVTFTRTDGGQYDNANTIYLTNTNVYGNIPSASSGLTVAPYGEGSGIYVNGTLDSGAVLATAAGWNGTFYVRPSANATAGTKLTIKGVFSSPDGSYRFAVQEVTYQYDGSKWSIYVEPTYTDMTITGIDGNTSASAIYLNLSASTGAGTWASFASVSETEGILYNGQKLNVNAQTTWVQNMFCIQPGKTPVAGDTLTIKGNFECSSIKLNVEEYTLTYNGSNWVKQEISDYTPISITGVDANTGATAIYLNLSASTEAGLWASFASDSASGTEGILYNGQKLSVNAQTTWVQNMFCIQPGKTPAVGDTLTIKGNFKCGTIKLNVASYTVTFNGTTWVAE